MRWRCLWVAKVLEKNSNYWKWMFFDLMAIKDSHVGPTLLGFQKVFNFWRSILYWSCWQKVECKFSRHDSWRSLFEDRKRPFPDYIHWHCRCRIYHCKRRRRWYKRALTSQNFTRVRTRALTGRAQASTIFSDSCCDVYCDVVTGLGKSVTLLKYIDEDDM